MDICNHRTVKPFILIRIWLLAMACSLLSTGLYAETEVRTLIRIGDQLQISFLGEEGFENSFEVDRQGYINLPEVGLVKVSGLTIEDLRSVVRQQLAQSYRNTEQLQINLKESRLLVTVLGYVQTPGEVNISGQGNLQMALTAAGGLKPGAQLDRIQIKRAGQVQVVDFKKYMDSGDEALIPDLQPLDIVFVPSSPLTGNVQVEFDAASLLAGGDAAEKKQSVRIFGEVHNPGTFSFEADQNMVDLLMRAGGVTRFASVSQIRLITEGEPQLFDLKAYLDSGSSRSMPAVAAGATIFVPMKEEEIKTGNSTIYIMGEVFRPGAYESKAEASFFDILANAGGPTRYARSREIRIIRRNGTVVNFDLQAYTEGLNTQSVPTIAAGDAIFVPEKNDLNQTSWLKISPDKAVHVLGAVTNPGRYEWSNEMTLLDLLAESSGPAKDADLAQLSIKRKGQAPEIFNLEAYLSGRDKTPLPQLKGGDTVIIPRQPELPSGNKAAWIKQSSEESVFILGQVGVPGRYRFSPELSFLDVLAAANGPSQQADLREVRVIHRNQSAVQLTQIDLALYFETGDQSLLPQLQAGDTIFIPDQVLTNYPNQAHKSVRIMGALNSPGYYRFNDDMNLLDLLALAGGPTSEALTEDVHIVHQGCCDTRTTHFDLRAYLKAPQAHLLPVVRAGDTVFMPVRSQSRWSESMALVRDLVSLLTLMLLL
ncbi:protein involved in polysaccharide export, contains SLBB domain of the beta-grasp fold [Oceanospirillum multiglobuliferum]|uniref:Sugar ABC transporter substrate-binding protein n=2 Tax=Oceanospirillum multiglobuliferum TaxID=64969 RepID=A0A1T4RXI3_9GAMM|nr:sugar ABC transporter substrate-binding protein [Oceanospirillum multiglobuliferum]SKA20663.1 protein involved in polysaccharide export, contains SLBB domain of the beta-grasp fold [Oceanospirillum multiglobuliferum]